MIPKQFVLDMVRVEPYRTMNMNNTTFHVVVELIQRCEEDKTLIILLEGLLTLAQDNERLKRELTDCIKRTPTKSFVVQSLPSKSRKGRRVV